MRTLLLQCLGTLLWISFGVISLRVARQGRFSPSYRVPWMLTGFAFVFVGTVKGVQNVFGSTAFFSGRGSAVWNSYLSWAPAFDHSRTTVLIAFFLLLLHRAGTSGEMPGRSHWIQTALILWVAALIGAVIGWKQQYINSILHYEAVAVLDAAELVVALGVLFAALIQNRVDRLLWFALCVYAFNLALNGLWMSVLAGLRVPGAWAPSPLSMHVFRVVLAATMGLIALRRLRLARRRVDVSGLLETPRPTAVSTLR